MDLNEIVKIFISYVVNEFKIREYIPNVNFVFDEKGVSLINDIMDFDENKIGDFWLKGNCFRSKETCDLNIPTIVVLDSDKFFELLNKIVKKQLKFETGSECYKRIDDVKKILMGIIFRMTPNDFDDVLSFLNRQLMFLEDKTFSMYENRASFKTFYGYETYVVNRRNNIWDESNFGMNFVVYNNNIVHELSKVNYDICEENGEKVCYICAVQNKGEKRNKNFERKLYKLKKDYGDIQVHPNQVFSLMIFMKMLQEAGISKIKVPIMYALDYDYHELLEKKLEKELEKCNNNSGPLNKQKKDYYDSCKICYKRIYNKVDLISKNKTEKFLNLFEAVSKCMELEITNDLWTNDGFIECTLQSTIGNKKPLKK